MKFLNGKKVKRLPLMLKRVVVKRKRNEKSLYPSNTTQRQERLTMNLLNWKANLLTQLGTKKWRRYNMI